MDITKHRMHSYKTKGEVNNIGRQITIRQKEQRGKFGKLSVIGLLVASFSAVGFGQLFNRDMERAMTGALAQSQYGFANMFYLFTN